MIQMEIRKKISNHPTIKDLEREVVVYRIADNMDVKQITISARIESILMLLMMLQEHC